MMVLNTRLGGPDTGHTEKYDPSSTATFSINMNTVRTGNTYSDPLANFRKGSPHTFRMIDNYIYFYHIGKFMLIPTYPESVTDTTAISYQSTTPLSRSAPIYSFANSGPRNVQFTLDLHRDMMQDINYNRSNYQLNNLAGQLDDDYIDVLIKELQAAAYPQYEASTKTVKPPIVAVRFGAEIFCKGVISSQVSVKYSGPLLGYEHGLKYAQASIGFVVSEIDPYSADMVMVNGSFRGLDRTLEKGLFRITDTSGKGNRYTSPDIMRGG